MASLTMSPPQLSGQSVQPVFGTSWVRLPLGNSENSFSDLFDLRTLLHYFQTNNLLSNEILTAWQFIKRSFINAWQFIKKQKSTSHCTEKKIHAILLLGKIFAADLSRRTLYYIIDFVFSPEIDLHSFKTLFALFWELNRILCYQILSFQVLVSETKDFFYQRVKIKINSKAEYYKINKDSCVR